MNFIEGNFTFLGIKTGLSAMEPFRRVMLLLRDFRVPYRYKNVIDKIQ